MGRYLNTDQRIRIVQFLLLKDMTAKTITLWDSLKFTKNVLKRLRTAVTHIDRAIEALLLEIGYDEALKLKDLADKTKIHFNYMPPQTKPPVLENTISDAETIDDVMEAVIEQHCKKCNGKKECCKIRDNFMIPWEAPVVNEYVSDLSEDCPFHYDVNVEIIRTTENYQNLIKKVRNNRG